MKKWQIICGTILLIAIVIIFIVLIKFESPAVAGVVGVLLGGIFTLSGSIVTSYINLKSSLKMTDEHLKDRVSTHALELTKMDYELRKKSLDVDGSKKYFLAPAKVYRTFYRALLELHTTESWPKEVEELGLLSIFPLSGD